MTPVLAAQSVTKQYPQGDTVIVACKNATLELFPGTFTVLRGPSGSGKTSLLNMLCGWERPDTGRVAWHDETVDPATLAWHQLAIIPQRLGLFPELTVAENITIAEHGSGDTNELIKALDLGAIVRHRPNQTSHGQQQRTAIARALSGAPEVLLADEPTSAQDEHHAHELLTVIRRHTDAGGTALVASHDPIVEEHATRSITMRDGQLT